MVSHTRVGRHEVWLDYDLIPPEPTLYKLVAHELRERDVPTHSPGPGTEQPVHAQHHCHRTRRAPAVSVARMDNSWPRHVPPETVFTDALLSKQHGFRAQEAIIVQGLYYGHPGVSGSVIHCGREQRERVVYVDDLRPFALEDGSHFPVRRPAPARPER